MKRILFMCVANACRSQMAEAFAKARGLPGVEVYSAGSSPTTRIHPVTVEVMREVGIDLSAARPKNVGQLPTHQFDVAVSLCGDMCPTARAKERRSWNIPDPRISSLEEFRLIRDQIHRRVERLMEEFAHAAPL